MMLRLVNKQQECKSFEIYAVTIKLSMTEYHPLINHQAHGLFYHSSLWWKSECGKSCHLPIFTSLKHLMMLLKHNFSGLHLYTLSKTMTSCKAIQLSGNIFFFYAFMWNNKEQTRNQTYFANPPVFVVVVFAFRRDITEEIWKWINAVLKVFAYPGWVSVWRAAFLTLQGNIPYAL